MPLLLSGLPAAVCYQDSGPVPAMLANNLIDNVPQNHPAWTRQACHDQMQ